MTTPSAPKPSTRIPCCHATDEPIPDRYHDDDAESHDGCCHGPVLVYIDALKYAIEAGLADGARIRRLAHPAISADRQLWLAAADSGMGIPVPDTAVVRIEGGERFYTVPFAINAG